ncbi:GH25 family lysozyme [Bacillus smithii]|uniref:GH25 family lysozyme n=1 Tax=Bacillus smithii TaxID=1479 RepID=UPI003D2551DF
MGKIVDLSHHQPSSKINWSLASKDIDLAIIRVQYGSKTEDKEHKNHVANCKKYGIPFGHYAYGCFVSVNDAIVEANDFLKRADKDTKFLVLDVEGDTVKACGTKNLAQASQAFIDTCKKAGYKVGLYVSHELYKQYGMDKVKADFLWLPRYGKDNGTPDLKPAYPCDLWQYSQNCKVSWYSGTVDLNLLIGSKPLDWFTGKPSTSSVSTSSKTKIQPAPKPQPVKPLYYIVRSGDTVSEIATKFHTTVDAIKALNKLKNVNKIYVGQKLRIK